MNIGNDIFCFFKLIVIIIIIIIIIIIMIIHLIIIKSKVETVNESTLHLHKYEETINVPGLSFH